MSFTPAKSVKLNKTYRCVWPDGDTEYVTTKQFHQNHTWVTIVWMEKRATMSPKLVDVQMNDTVPVDWLEEV